MFKLVIPVALALGFSSHAVLAQVWTFDRVFQSALASHPAVMGKLSSAAARAEREGAEWQRYPTPSIEAAQSSSGGGVSTVLRVQQPLWTGSRERD
ncbi:MAG: TolC family protein [Rhodocyclaceae bacterium]|nr:TolC family protein [Rhodocyclaceae bacterium]